MSDASKIWYSHVGNYAGESPPYYDLNGIEWYDKLKSELPEIQAKLLTFLKMDGVKPKQFFNTKVVEGTRWDGLGFLFWGIKIKKNIKKGSAVFDYFKDIPGLVSLSVSVLQPKTRIKAHEGDTDAIYRIHIPVYIPAQLPDCGVKVDGITKPWKENEIIAFCDAYFHEAWNMTDEARIILIVDVIKEEFLPYSNKVCAIVLLSMKYQFLAGKFKFIEPLVRWTPKWIKNTIRRLS